MHFMNPVPVMKLVEVIVDMRLRMKLLLRSWTCQEKLGKSPIEVNDYPGFIANRILMPMINEAYLFLV